MEQKYDILQENFQLLFNSESISELDTAYYHLMNLLSNTFIKNESEGLIRVLEEKYRSKKNALYLAMKVQYLVTIWIFICVVGVISNMTVIIIMIRNQYKLIYEIFCIGLAFTDIAFLLLAVSLTSVHYMKLDWFLGSFMCKLVSYLIQSMVFSSSIILVGLTFSRFLAVLHPWKNRNMTPNGSKLACIAGWIIGFWLSSPVFHYYDIRSPQFNQSAISKSNNTEDGIRRKGLKCKLDFPSNKSRNIVIIGLLNLSYLIPFFGILVMNMMVVYYVRRMPTRIESHLESKQKCKSSENYRDSLLSNDVVTKVKLSKLFRHRRMQKRVTKIVLLVTSIYGLFWLPINIINSWSHLSPQTLPRETIMNYLIYISQTLSFCSACVNPIIYSISSNNFKTAFINQFPCFQRFCINGVQKKKSEVFTAIVKDV